MVEEARPRVPAHSRRPGPAPRLPARLQDQRRFGASHGLAGDQIIVNHAAYAFSAPYSGAKLFRTGSPKRGDFVFLRLPNNSRLKGKFFKRVIGLPGENVELRENRVFIDGRPLSVKPLDAVDFKWVPNAHPIGSVVESEDGHWITFTPGICARRNHPPTKLAAGQYFLLGDNRDDSFDSRDFGPVSEAFFLGKVIAVLHTGERIR